MLKKLLNWGFKYNVWIWFHIMAGGFFAKLGLIWFDRWDSLLIVSVCAICWEYVEFFVDGGIDGMIRIYGSLEKWFYDSLGDVVGAVLMALVVVI